MKVQSILMTLVVLVVATGCTSTKIDKLAAPDPYQKTISVPASTGKLTADVKETLKQNNWQFDNNGQPLTSPRYSMTLTYEQAEYCMPRFDPMYDYDLTITDNKMGTRVFAMHGRDCQHTILDQLSAFLQNKKM